MLLSDYIDVGKYFEDNGVYFLDKHWRYLISLK